MQPARTETPLKQVLDAEGRRHSWLAAELGVHTQTVHTWVHGWRVPIPENQRKIAELLGRDVDELFPPDDNGKAA